MLQTVNLCEMVEMCSVKLSLLSVNWFSLTLSACWWWEFSCVRQDKIKFSLSLLSSLLVTLVLSQPGSQHQLRTSAGRVGGGRDGELDGGPQEEAVGCSLHLETVWAAQLRLSSSWRRWSGQRWLNTHTNTQTHRGRLTSGGSLTD